MQRPFTDCKRPDKALFGALSKLLRIVKGDCVFEPFTV